MPFPASFSIILTFWITPSCQEFITAWSFYQISIPGHLVPPPPLVKHLLLELPSAPSNPQDFPQSSLYSAPSGFNPAPFSQLWSPCPPNTVPPLVLRRPLRMLLSASSTSSSWSVYSLDGNSTKVLKQVPSLLSNLLPLSGLSAPSASVITYTWIAPIEEGFKADKKRVGLNSCWKGDKQYLPEVKKEIGGEREERIQGQLDLDMEIVVNMGFKIVFHTTTAPLYSLGYHLRVFALA